MVKLGNHGPIYKDLSLFTGTLRRARVTVELLRQEMPNFLASNLWIQTAHISVLWITRSGQDRVYHRRIYSVDELKRRLIDV